MQFLKTMALGAILLSVSPLCHAKIFTPQQDRGHDVAIVLFPGADLRAEQYEPLAKRIQQAFPFNVWINLVDTKDNSLQQTGVPAYPHTEVEEIFAAGMPIQAPVYLAGHATGGAKVIKILETGNERSAFAGAILLGSYIPLDSRTKLSQVPILTVVASRDGLTRVTRFAEMVYHQSNKGKNLPVQPVVVVEGMNHMQFASGEAPLSVRQRDLRATIGEADAQNETAAIIAAFLEARTSPSSKAVATLQNSLTKSAVFLQPVIDAMILEGSYYLKPPCYTEGVDPNDCWRGSPWTEMTQRALISLPDINVNVVDSFHHVWRVFPFYHPKIKNSCDKPDASCHLELTTVSQAVYAEAQGLDTGGYADAAYEIRAKLKSRQAILEATGGSAVKFEESDGGSWCGRMNQRAIEWAEAHAPTSVIEIYKREGIPLVVGDDIGPLTNGPMWIWMPLSEKYENNNQGKLVREVRSPVMKTPLDHPIKPARGFHFCKLLSPARVMEWVYVDSQRQPSHDASWSD